MNAIEDKILSLVKLANPEDPITYTKSILKSYCIEKINSRIKACEKCDLCKNRIKSISYGNINASILIISDSISQEQFDKGDIVTTPLLDTDGETLNKALGVINASINSVYMVNAVNCFPANQKNNEIIKRIPSVKERTTCKSFVDDVINAINPAVIITLGSVSSNALSSNKLSIMSDRGNEFNYNGYRVIPTFSPGFFREMEDKYDLEMMNYYKDLFLQDLYKAFSIAKEYDSNIGELVQIE